MSDRPTISPPEDASGRVLDGGFWLVVAMAAMLVVLVLAVAAGGVLAPAGAGAGPGWTAPAAANAGGIDTPGASSGPPIDVATFSPPPQGWRRRSS